MKTFIFILLFGLLGLKLSAQLTYPLTPKVEVSDTLWGTVYKDNYRWLEDMKDPKVISWFKAQAELTDSVMQTISGRNELLGEWYKLFLLIPPTYSSESEAGGRFFFQMREPGDKVSKVYCRETINGDDQLLFDPMTFISGKTLSVEYVTPSYDGKKLLIGYAEQGAEISTIMVMDVDSKTFLTDEIPASVFSIEKKYKTTRLILTTFP